MKYLIAVALVAVSTMGASHGMTDIEKAVAIPMCQNMAIEATQNVDARIIILSNCLIGFHLGFDHKGKKESCADLRNMHGDSAVTIAKQVNQDEPGSYWCGRAK